MHLLSRSNANGCRELVAVSNEGLGPSPAPRPNPWRLPSRPDQRDHLECTGPRRSPSARCANPAFAASWSIAQITSAAITSPPAPILGRITLGCPILSRVSFAPLVAGVAPTSGRIFTGIRRACLRGAIDWLVAPLIYLKPKKKRGSVLVCRTSE